MQSLGNSCHAHVCLFVCVCSQNDKKVKMFEISCAFDYLENVCVSVCVFV